MGENCWIGEECWIDNWAPVELGNNVCLSQGAYLCTGNHDWSDPSFAIAPRPITVRDGAWVGARVLLGPGVELGTGSIATIGSVVIRSIPDWEIHSGNPARMHRKRLMRPPSVAGPVRDPVSAA